VTGAADGSVWVWNADSGARIGQVAHGKHVNSVAFSPDGKLILSAGDNVVREWNASDFTFVRNVGQHDAEVRCARYSPDGNLIVTASGNFAWIWAAKARAPIKLEHKADVNSVAFSPDSKLIVTGNADNTAGVWDAQNGKLIAVLTGHTGQILKAVFSPDSQSILTTSEDRTAHIFPREAFAPFEEIRYLIGQRVARELTQAEIDEYLSESAEP